MEHFIKVLTPPDIALLLILVYFMFYNAYMCWKELRKQREEERYMGGPWV